MDVQGLSGSKPTNAAAAANKPPAAADGGSAAPEGASGASSRPEWVPEDHWDPEAGSLKLDSFGQHYSELSQFHKEQSERLAGLPQKPEDVKFTLPEGLDLPGGAVIDDNDPMLAEARQIVVDDKLDPAAANKLFGLYAKKQAAELKAIGDRVVSEQAKLGPNHVARVDAVTTALTAAIGKDLAAELVGPGKLWTAGQVLALEAIQKKLSSQGAATPQARPHQPPQPPPKTLTDRLFPISKAG